MKQAQGSIYILGNSGSGKSTLAKAMSKERRMPHIDLDQFAWLETPGERRPLSASVSAVENEVAGAAVIVEGMYSDIVGTCIQDTDALIWLDVSLEECIAHCKARPFEPHKWESKQAQDAFLPQLLAFLPTYLEDDGPLSRAAHSALFEVFPGKKLRLSTAEGAVDAVALVF